MPRSTTRRDQGQKEGWKGSRVKVLHGVTVVGLRVFGIG